MIRRREKDSKKGEERKKDLTKGTKGIDGIKEIENDKNSKRKEEKEENNGTNEDCWNKKRNEKR